MFDRSVRSLGTNTWKGRQHALARFLTPCLLAMEAVLVWEAGVATGGQGRQLQVATTSVAQLPAGFVAVPFAVPVGLPSYVQYQAVDWRWMLNAPTAWTPAREGLAPVGAAGAAGSAAEPAVAAASPRTLTAGHCGKCHGAVNPKAGLDLTSTLPEDVRLRAIGRLLADDPRRRMPPAQELPPAVLGRLIQEFAAAPADRSGSQAEPAPQSPSADSAESPAAAVAPSTIEAPR